MGTQKNAVSDIVRLGNELKSRGFTVYSHPMFGGVHPTAHDPKGAHYRPGGEAIDVGRDYGGATSVLERRHMDRLAVELDARGFAPIWNRGPGDHEDHLHVATGRWRGAAGYRYRLSASREAMALTVDGRWGPKTWRGLAWALHMPNGHVERFDAVSAYTKALQRVLRTEMLSDTLEVDGRLGPKTWRALGTVLGVDGGRTPTTSMNSLTAVLQLMITAVGRVV